MKKEIIIAMIMLMLSSTASASWWQFWVNDDSNINNIKGDKGDKGNKGDKGDKGDTGAQGTAGKDGIDGKDGIQANGVNNIITGISGWERVSATSDNLAKDELKRVQVSCTGNKKVLGGGAYTTMAELGINGAIASFPSSDNTWQAGAKEYRHLNEGGYPHAWSVTVYAICADVTADEMSQVSPTLTQR